MRTCIRITAFTLLFICMGCRESGHPRDAASAVVVFKHGKIAGDPEDFKRLLETFEKENPGIKVRDETLPSSSDEQHQSYVINLESRSSDFDVLAMDVVWVQEFARAGWIADVTRLLPETEKHDYFPGPLRAVTFRDRIYAIPWYIDAGLLYYRKDLLAKYGFRVPKTWQELVETAAYITAREKDIYGYIWQGKQYEGLVCNVLEFLRSNGGEVLDTGRVVVDSPQNVHALGFMRDLIVKYRVTPPLVTTAIEEPTRHIFGGGRALFMRNWPYAWNIFQKENSAVKGRVGVASLPSFPGGRPSSTLGGWQLGINKFSRNTEAAEKLIRFLTSPSSEKALALGIGYKPPRKSLYRDKELVSEQPFIAGLYDIFMHADPRPVSPYYMMMTQVLQPEFSAAITGVKPPGKALGSAAEQIGQILKAGQ